MRYYKILSTAFDYRPRLGGIATLSYELFKEMGKIPGVQIKLIAPEQKNAELFDVKSSIDTLRISISPQIPKAVLQFSRAIAYEALHWEPCCIFHTVWIPDAISSWLCTPVRAYFKIPYFVFTHGVELLESSQTTKKKIRKLFSPIKKNILQNAAKIFANSHFTKNLLFTKCNVPLTNIVVANPGVDIEKFFPSEKAQDLIEKYQLQNKIVLLTVTRLDPYKGIDQMIQAMPALIKKYPNLVYLVCGEGNDRDRLYSLAQDKGLNSYVKFVGAVPFDRLRDYYNLADLYVMLSREHIEPPDIEGFGISFIEAAACAIPALAGNSGGIPDAVEDEVSGWLVNPTDTNLIISKLDQILANPSLIKTTGQHAKKRALNKFTWKHMAETIFTEVSKSLSVTKT
ncbi:MAG: glycosyltransferase family 4 protein [Deltaproteobacteria bacterium]|nr:glycosyltransferase family 4 protein [Deltaproteobacteria bacterium]